MVIKNGRALEAKIAAPQAREMTGACVAPPYPAPTKAARLVQAGAHPLAWLP